MQDSDGIERGTWVVTADGKDVGRVQEVVETEVRIGAPGKLDFWLELSHVRSRSDRELQLDVTNEELLAVKH